MKTARIVERIIIEVKHKKRKLQYAKRKAVSNDVIEVACCHIEACDWFLQLINRLQNS